MAYKHVLVTGGAGFIGSNFVHHLLKRYDYRVTVLDALTYAGNPDNLRDVFGHSGLRFAHADICDAEAVRKVFATGVDAVVHFAAESHVDRSISGPMDFTRTNVVGTHTLLEAARAAGLSRFVHISTDEVYGSLGESGYFTEESPLQPSSPYSASKIASDLMVLAYYHTFKLPVVVTRCSNNYGPYQFPEKLIPVLVEKALADQPLPIYGDGLNVRDWLHVEDHCAAIDLVLHQGRPGEVYNIGGFGEMTNLAVARLILGQLGKPESLISFVADRPGHDRRYAMDPAKITAELSWRPGHSVEKGIAETVQWYVRNREWVERIRSGQYREALKQLDPQMVIVR